MKKLRTAAGLFYCRDFRCLLTVKARLILTIQHAFLQA